MSAEAVQSVRILVRLREAEAKIARIEAVCDNNEAWSDEVGACVPIDAIRNALEGP